jgi:hypothetical protein
VCRDSRHDPAAHRGPQYIQSFEKVFRDVAHATKSADSFAWKRRGRVELHAATASIPPPRATIVAATVTRALRHESFRRRMEIRCAIHACHYSSSRAAAARSPYSRS